jgi:hypothetical protein
VDAGLQRRAGREHGAAVRCARTVTARSTHSGGRW